MGDMNATGLGDRLASDVEKVGAADILVGIPSYKNAATIVPARQGMLIKR